MFANEDINNVKKQINYYGGGSSSGGSSGGGVSSPSPSGNENMYMDGNGTVVEDLSAYLEELYAAQRRQTLANLDNAYQQNVNAINRAGEGVDARYQNARNQAAGASELAARNFAEYAAASGLNSGAGGQAELARNVTLQNNLNDINTAEAEVYADLELQLANAETEYNNAIAQAEASNDFALAESLYQEKVRVHQELVNQQMQQYQTHEPAIGDEAHQPDHQIPAVRRHGKAIPLEEEMIRDLHRDHGCKHKIGRAHV